MEVKIRDEYIKLEQLLKFTNLVESGGEAKIVINEGLVKVNGEVELRRGKKIRENDKVEFNGETIVVK
ncbi:RNA-binding S4 domain-containing protein [Oceanivirga miroungae]|uniref:S4 domain-containing protein YaaA n=1 Tax=Oceanivirga miroungae TaxID=1130046 RepID=A0A6I8M964_9FUSO|nr:RNA-binding S4 domain-containing protein [Oceanivirga miroungae]VWL84823.1 S4 domain-containing protein YaaA [Oceanivirga miroungae]